MSKILIYIGYVYDIKRGNAFIPSCAQSDHSCSVRCAILEKKQMKIIMFVMVILLLISQQKKNYYSS